MRYYRLMKRYITDTKLLKILSMIEKWIRYPIWAVPMPEEMRRSHMAAVAVAPLFGHMWQFLHNPGELPPSQFTLCHELMHIILGIEGWPVLLTPESLR
jgi:hypothetical protein